MGIFDFFRKHNNVAKNEEKMQNIIDQENELAVKVNSVPIIVNYFADNEVKKRNFRFWENVRSVYKSTYAGETRKFMEQLANAHLIKINPVTKQIELNINDEAGLLRLSIYTTEFDRFVAFIFKNWFIYKFPNLTELEIKYLDNIVNSSLSDIINTSDMQGLIHESLVNSINRCDDFKKININDCKYGIFDGKGNIIKINEGVSGCSQELAAHFEAMSWMMVDIIFTTSKTSKSLTYAEIVNYLQQNHIPLNIEKDADALDSMRMVRMFAQFSDAYLKIAQTVNWIASK